MFPPYVRDQVSQPYRTTGKNYSLVYFDAFGQQMRRQKVLDRMVAGITTTLSPLNFLLNQI
jgi:hypothetical protein